MRAVLAFCVLLALSSTSEAQIPPLLNYQGHLTSETSLSNPIETVFSIYSTLEDGQPLWTETHLITHQQGSFSVLLGGQTLFPADLFEDAHRYLEIRVGNDQALRPRQRIVSTAYAFKALRAENAVGHLTPQSITLGPTLMDTTGLISTPLIQTDSLSIGGIGIINRQGQWTGPPLPTNGGGMILDTLIVKSSQNNLSFGSSNCLDIDGTTDAFTAFVNLKETGFIDASFHTTISATGNAFETRIVIAPINPSGDPITNVSNISRFVPRTSADEGILNNQAAVRVGPGLYRVFIQGQIEGIGTLLTGILTVRVFSR